MTTMSSSSSEKKFYDNWNKIFPDVKPDEISFLKEPYSKLREYWDAEKNVDHFINTIQKAGKTPETVNLLRVMFPGILDTHIDELLGVNSSTNNDMFWKPDTPEQTVSKILESQPPAKVPQWNIPAWVDKTILTPAYDVFRDIEKTGLEKNPAIKAISGIFDPLKEVARNNPTLSWGELFEGVSPPKPQTYSPVLPVTIKTPTDLWRN